MIPTPNHQFLESHEVGKLSALFRLSESDDGEMKSCRIKMVVPGSNIKTLTRNDSRKMQFVPSKITPYDGSAGFIIQGSNRVFNHLQDMFSTSKTSGVIKSPFLILSLTILARCLYIIRAHYHSHSSVS